MLPIPSAALGRIDLTALSPVPSGPNPSAPGAFNRVYDKMLTKEDVASIPRLPTQMEVRMVMPSDDMSQPFMAPPPSAPRMIDGMRIADPTLSIDGRATTADRPPLNEALQPFLSPFKQGLQEVIQLQGNAEKLANEAAIGGDVDLHDVMISAEKAGVAMQLTLQVRNKLVEAYQDVMRMQI